MVGTQSEQCQPAVVMIVILVHRWDTKIIATVLLMIVTIITAITKGNIMKKGIVTVHIILVGTTEMTVINIQDRDTIYQIELTGGEMNHRLVQVRKNRDTIVLLKTTH